MKHTCQTCGAESERQLDQTTELTPGAKEEDGHIRMFFCSWCGVMTIKKEGEDERVLGPQDLTGEPSIPLLSYFNLAVWLSNYWAGLARDLAGQLSSNAEHAPGEE